MSDEPSPSPFQPGQAAPAPDTGTTATAPAAPGGPADAQPSQGQDGGQPMQAAPTGEPFFDPSNLSPELLPAYKQMQAAFTQKTQALSQNRQKIEAFDRFMADPIGGLQQLASQYGLQITRAQAAAAVAQQQQPEDPYANWEPQRWGDVIDTTQKAVAQQLRQELRQEILQELSPYLGQVQQMQAKNVEAQLTQIDPNWKAYEPKMRDLLAAHPTLANDISMLYRLAVPPEMVEAKAMQQVLKQYEQKAKQGQVTAQGTAPRSQPASPKISSFEEAWADAKRRQLSGEV